MSGSLKGACRIVALVAVICGGMAPEASAQERSLLAASLAEAGRGERVESVPDREREMDRQLNAGVPFRLATGSRPASLAPLYVSFAALQLLDAHSTRRALDAGHREANPFMAGIASNPAALVSIKAATAAGTILLSERLWKKNRLAAVVVMVALNSASAAIVAHNYRTVRAGR